MKTNSFSDSILYRSAKILSGIFSILPLPAVLWIGRRVGDLAFWFYPRRGEVAYANLKACLGERFGPSELLRVKRRIFQNLMQTAAEILRFPKVNRAYLDRYVTFQGLDRLEAALKKGKGLVALTAHLGNWELQSFAGAARGYPSHVLAREQGFPKANGLLNRYRELTGCRVIHKGFMTREILRHLRSNGIVGMLIDQDAGKNGLFVNFFGRPTSFAKGAIAFSLKTGCEVIPCFARREADQAHHVIEITEPLRIPRTGNEEEDIREGLQQFAYRLETFIRNYPDQWLWLHKRWKSSPTRQIAILNDGKAGHLNQSLGVGLALQKVLKEEGKEAKQLSQLDIHFKSRWHRLWAAALSLQANRRCQGCLKCLKFALTPSSFERLVRGRADFVISAGSAVAPVNRILSLDNAAKSVVVMDPVLPSASRFDLAIIPEHDHPSSTPHIVTTAGAPHPLTEERVAFETSRLSGKIGKIKGRVLGLLFGGETAGVRWSREDILAMVEGITEEAKKGNFEFLVSTSRRTSKETEALFESSWKEEPRCKLLVLANRENPEGVVPGILGLSDLVVVTGESVSMISEASSIAERVLVFLPGDWKKDSKRDETLLRLSKSGQVVLTGPAQFRELLRKTFQTKGRGLKLNDSLRIEKGLKKIL